MRKRYRTGYGSASHLLFCIGYYICTHELHAGWLTMLMTDHGPRGLPAEDDELNVVSADDSVGWPSSSASGAAEVYPERSST